MKKELLVPVGNLNTLKYAVMYGADAVYLGGKSFGARANALNFSNEELITAVKYCHLYGVKIYVTVNTLIYENEKEEFLNFIRFLHKIGVDAIIMQDLGMISLVRKTFPNFVIHASTQMHNHNIAGIKLLENLGVKRVVLARELSLNEINNLDSKLELEAFIHGALCISYSGQCLFSSLLLNRSGNRGECAGICRLPFKLLKNKEVINTNYNYLLSPKDLETFSNFEKIMKSNVYSLKIEGRMKSPYYVAFTTSFYRNLIDNYNENKSLVITDEGIKNLKVLYNREFTKGFLFNDDNILNIKNPNHQGIKLGKILKITKDKIKILLEEDLDQEDAIRFPKENKGLVVNFLYNEKGLLINKALKGDIVYIDNKIDLKDATIVLKTISKNLEKSLDLLPERKIKIDVKIMAKLGEELILSITDGVNKVKMRGSVLEKSINNPTTVEVIKSKLTFGNTPFIINNLEIEKDEEIFINASELKRLKREAGDKLIHLRENFKPSVFKEIKVKEEKELKNKSKITINAMVRKEEQLKACLEEDIDNIYVEDEKLYEKYKNKNIYLRLSRVMNNFKDYNHENLLVGEVGSLYKYYQNNNIITDYFLNVTNNETINFLNEYKVKKVTLSIENKDINLKALNKKNTELIIYIKPEVMIMKTCLLKNLVNEDKVCRVCFKDTYSLQDRNNKIYPLITSRDHLNHLYFYKNIDLVEKLDDYIKEGFINFRIDFFDETKEEARSIIRKITNVNN